MSTETVEREEVAEIEFPVVEAKKATGPRIHVGGSTCLGCEG